MSDLVEFLKARLDEDEAAARAAVPGPWIQFLGGVASGTSPGDDDFREVCEFFDPHDERTEENNATAAHIARHDPARVLREVEAKRRLISMYQPPDVAQLPDSARWLVPEQGFIWGAQAEHALRILASAYSDHPDYRAEWAV